MEVVHCRPEVKRISISTDADSTNMGERLPLDPPRTRDLTSSLSCNLHPAIFEDATDELRQKVLLYANSNRRTKAGK
jgi:hypothetical protein